MTFSVVIYKTIYYDNKLDDFWFFFYFYSIYSKHISILANTDNF